MLIACSTARETWMKIYDENWLFDDETMMMVE